MAWLVWTNHESDRARGGEERKDVRRHAICMQSSSSSSCTRLQEIYLFYSLFPICNNAPSCRPNIEKSLCVFLKSFNWLNIKSLGTHVRHSPHDNFFQENSMFVCFDWDTSFCKRSRAEDHGWRSPEHAQCNENFSQWAMSQWPLTLQER